MMKQICSFNGNYIRSIILFQRLQLRHSTSSSNKDEGNHDCSIAEFLVKSMGFSQKQSLSLAANMLKTWRTDDSSSSNFSSCNAHSVIQFFHELGFQQSDIKKVVSHHPRFLCSNVDKSLKPKIELLRELGFTGSDLICAVLRNPKLLCQNFGPAIHAFRVVVGNDDNVVTILKRSFFINSKGVADYLIANVELLRSYGIPTADIRKYIIRHPQVFIKKTDWFRAILIKVEEMLGIPRGSSMFLYGVHLLCAVKEKSLEDKFAVFRSFGWTQSDIMALIRRNPLCLVSSEARTRKLLGFAMNQLDYKPDYLASKPCLLTHSLEKTLLPRHRVLQVLKEKGLCKKDYPLCSAVGLSESDFLRKFVLPYEIVHQVYAELKGCEVGSMLQK